jgi:hypothetical protein
MRRVSPARDILLTGALLFALAACGGVQRWENEWQEIVGSDLGTEELIQAAEAFLLKEPPLRYASEARFTIGFAWAEGLERFGEARRWFTELLEEDPEGGWSEEARWMLENMEKDADEILPDLEQLEQEIPPAPERETPPGR